MCELSVAIDSVGCHTSTIVGFSMFFGRHFCLASNIVSSEWFGLMAQGNNELTSWFWRFGGSSSHPSRRVEWEATEIHGGHGSIVGSKPRFFDQFGSWTVAMHEWYSEVVKSHCMWCLQSELPELLAKLPLSSFTEVQSTADRMVWHFLWEKASTIPNWIPTVFEKCKRGNAGGNTSRKCLWTKWQCSNQKTYCTSIFVSKKSRHVIGSLGESL